MANMKKTTRVTEDDRRALREISAHGLPDHPTARGLKPADIKRALADPVVGQETSVMALLIRLTAELFEYEAALEVVLDALRGDVDTVGDAVDNMLDGVGGSIAGIAGEIADSRLSAHNAGSGAHPDMRAAISAIISEMGRLNGRLNAIFDSDDETMDQWSELLAFVRDNRDLIAQVTTSKVSVDDVVDNLYNEDPRKPLSANMGYELLCMIQEVREAKLDATRLTDAINAALREAKESGAFGSDPAWTIRKAGYLTIPVIAWTEQRQATVTLPSGAIEDGDRVLLFPSDETTRSICENHHIHVNSSPNATADSVLFFQCQVGDGLAFASPLTFAYRVLVCKNPLSKATAEIVGVSYDEVNRKAIGELNDKINYLAGILAGDGDGGMSIRQVAEEVVGAHDSSVLAHADIRELIETLTANVYDKVAVDRLVSLIPKLTIEPVEALPELENASLTAFYLVPSGEGESDVYTEWFCVEKDGVRSWERLGTQKMDLSGYATTAAMNAAIANAIADALVGYVTGVEVDGKISKALSDYVDTSALQTALTEALKSYAKTTAIPAKLSQLGADESHRTVTDAEKAVWNAKAPGNHTHDGLYQAKGDYQPAGNYAAEGHLHDDLYVKKGEAVDGVPSYVVDEGKAVADKVTAVRDAYSFVFGAISDLHTDGEASAASIRHAGMGMHEIHKRTRLDAVLNFGDVIVTDLAGAYAEGFPFVRSCLDDVTRGVPYIQMQGNHDEYDSAYSETEEKQKYFAYIGANNAGTVTDWPNRHRNYGYRDFEDEKMRVVYLNSVDLSTIETTDSTLGGNDCYISGAQFKWFIETALDFSGKSDAENWSFVVCCHHPLNWYGVTMPKLLAVLKAYRDKASGSVVADGITTSYDFTGAKAMLVAHFHGHLHNFRAETLDGVPTITIPNACFGRNNEYGQNESQKEKWGDADANGTQRIFNKVSDSADDTSFNVIVVDRTNEVVHCINYGAGIDRVVSYGAAPKVYRSITNTLSNVATSNSASSVEDGASYSATLTASEDYSLTGGTVSVKMGGVDITATAYSSGVINIASVTGDVVIVATAVSTKPSYTNLIDTVGYTDGVRLSTSSGGESAEEGHVTTGYIPLTTEDKGAVFRTKGVDFNFVSGVNKSAYVVYTSSKAKSTSNNIKEQTSSGLSVHLDSEGNITSLIINDSMPSGGGYLRICGKGSGANLIVTKNEEIV